VPSLAISGYRSFGKIPQFFEKFEKINLFIGENNCGKSNILKLIHEVLPAFNSQTLKLKDLDRNLYAGGAFQVGLALTKEKLDVYIENKKIQPPQSNVLLKIFERICKLNPSNNELKYAWFLYDQNKQLQFDNWQEAFSDVDKNELNRLAASVLNHVPSNDRNILITKILEQIKPSPVSFKSQFIPAIRKIGDHGSQFEIFDGNGIIEELAKYQNPEAGSDLKKNREKFQLINSFLQNVLNDKNAVLEIPYGRKTILVHLANKTLPLDNLGTGVHEVIILAAASTIMKMGLYA
ncbi:AAA family ATPase, partial [Legionella sainthelensi]|uniref:AAA family ATPase n=1 Tax=Legionella sainthelensi TaxID=28087 RepID=UPI00135CA441